MECKQFTDAFNLKSPRMHLDCFLICMISLLRLGYFSEVIMGLSVYLWVGSLLRRPINLLAGHEFVRRIFRILLFRYLLCDVIGMCIEISFFSE
jgi:hypothetical protein